MAVSSPESRVLFLDFSMVHSQGSLLVFRFPGLTEEETRHCVQYETKTRFLFFTIHRNTEERCTTNKLSEKYEGNSTFLAVCPVCTEAARHLAILHMTAMSSLILFDCLEVPRAVREGINKISLALLKKLKWKLGGGGTRL